MTLQRAYIAIGLCNFLTLTLYYAGMVVKFKHTNYMSTYALSSCLSYTATVVINYKT